MKNITFVILPSLELAVPALAAVVPDLGERAGREHEQRTENGSR